MLLKFFSVCALGVLLAKAACREATQENAPNTDLTLQVYHYKVPCVGESVQLCYKIERRLGEAEYFYDAIAGFTYEWGYNYTLIVTKKSRKPAMADASSAAYTLKKIVKKEKVPPGETFELPLRIDDQSLVETKKGNCFYLGDRAIETGTFNCSDLARGTTATFRHSADQQRMVLVTLK